MLFLRELVLKDPKKSFHNNFTKKDARYKMKSLKAYREDSTLQSLARVVVDFRLDDKDRFNFLSIIDFKGQIRKMQGLIAKKMQYSMHSSTEPKV